MAPRLVTVNVNVSTTTLDDISSSELARMVQWAVDTKVVQNLNKLTARRALEKVSVSVAVLYDSFPSSDRCPIFQEWTVNRGPAKIRGCVLEKWHDSDCVFGPWRKL